MMPYAIAYHGQNINQQTQWNSHHPTCDDAIFAAIHHLFAHGDKIGCVYDLPV